MRNFIFRIFILLFYITLKFSDAKGQYIYSFQWGTPGSGNKQFSSPAAIAINQTTGDVYIADAGNNRIQRFSSTGVYISQWGSQGNEDGYFNYPTGIAIDGSGNVYVADQNNNRIQKFNSSGSFLGKFGSPGNSNGQFRSPSAVAVDVLGYIYVADAGNDRIQRFNGSFSHTNTWGGHGSSSNQFKYPTSIAVFEGYIYVADQNNNRIQKLNWTTGLNNGVWTQAGMESNFYALSSIFVGSSGVFISDSGNDRIVKLTNSGNHVTTVGQYGTGNGRFSNCSGSAVNNSTGNLYVVDQNNNRIQVFSPSLACSSCQYNPHSLLTSWGEQGTGTGEFTGPMGIAVDQDGNVFVADAGNNRIQKFTNTGSFLHQWGSLGSNSGEFDSPMGIAVDKTGNVYVADRDNHRVQKFNNTGSFITSWGGMNYPKGIAVDNSGNVFVSDTYGVKKFSSSGTYITSCNGTFSEPFGVAIDGPGNVFVVERGNDRVQKFNNNGVYISTWGTNGSGNGQFNIPTGIAVDACGDVFVTDQSHNRVQKFNNNGTYLTQWNTGTDPWVDIYQWIATDNDGKIYVSDVFIPGVKVYSGYGPRTTITSFTPSSGGICPTVVITGTGFTGATAIHLNGIAATSFTVNNSTQITATFPSTGISTGTITVTGVCNVAVSSTDFTVVDYCNINTYSYDDQWEAPQGICGDIAIDASDNIYITGPDNYFRKYSSIGQLLGTWGGTGTGNGLFDWPTGIAVDQAGTVYVVDQGNNLMQIFNSSGFVNQWSLGSNTLGQQLTIDKSGNNLYMVNDLSYGSTGNNRIKKYSVQGTLISEFGHSPLYGPNTIVPQGIAVDECNNVFIVNSWYGVHDPEFFNMEVIKYNGNNGTLLTRWGNFGSGNGQFAYPKGISVDLSGNVYVCDGKQSVGINNNRIQKFSNTGQFLGTWGGPGFSDGQFNTPWQVAVTPSCSVFVKDMTSRMQIFTPGSGFKKAAQAFSNLPEKIEIIVHPNPSEGKFNISVPGESSYELSLFNSLGEVVFKATSSGENYVIDNHDLREGVYVLRVSGSKIHQTKLIVAK